ncbi:MAG: hypothetical protein EOP24_27475 [Hyphomicrobiales bacterium]|nr:MAG: hypothetical protein EOP24_27475 [Hyphomicrobiales bacterium]
MVGMSALLPYGKTDGKTMAKRNRPEKFDNGFTLTNERTNELTNDMPYLDISSYASNVREIRAGFIARGHENAAASRGPIADFAVIPRAVTLDA